ncbi:MAG: TIGR04283 family arsenosugar biosynthesis glycosyltransferase [Limisphaerales bacterium]
MRNDRPISVIIPVLNEEVELPETLRRVAQVPEVGEAIVVDGGSRDRTREVARENGAIVIRSEPGRGVQLRTGTEAASGEVILLLHADTWLPSDAGRAALDLLERPGVVAGGYWKRFRDDVPWTMRGARLRCRLLLEMFGYIFGDQGFFLKRSTLNAIGGVPPVPLMEELEMCQRLRDLGRLELAKATVTTAWRKFEKHGIVRTYLLMAKVLRAYHKGVPLEELRRIYQG